MVGSNVFSQHNTLIKGSRTNWTCVRLFTGMNALVFTQCTCKFGKILLLYFAPDVGGSMVNHKIPPSANAFQQNRQPYGRSPVWMRVWICCELRDPNVLPHSLQGNWRPDTFVCECRWFINDRPSGKSSPHTSHVTDLFRWDCMCRLSRALLWNVLPHIEQEWFFSVECSHECFISDLLSRHCLPHNLHVFSLISPSCKLAMCFLMVDSSRNVSPHSIHLNGLRACTSACANKSKASINDSPQTLQQCWVVVCTSSP